MLVEAVGNSNVKESTSIVVNFKIRPIRIVPKTQKRGDFQGQSPIIVFLSSLLFNALSYNFHHLPSVSD